MPFTIRDLDHTRALERALMFGVQYSCAITRNYPAARWLLLAIPGF